MTSKSFAPDFLARPRLAASLAACVLLAACGQTTMTAKQSGVMPAPKPMVPAGVSGSQLDAMFMERAMQSDMLEIAASKVAVEQSTNPQVQDFARQMVQDHTANAGELQKLASARGVTGVPQTLPADETRFQQLRSAQGGAFDRMYAQWIAVAAHTEAVSLYEQQANQGADSELRSFAARKLPALQHHLKMGLALGETLK